jgi:hypothetical protein
MDNDTLQVILSRFDKLDEKIDGALREHSDLRVDVEAVKGDVALLKDKADSLTGDAKFTRRVTVVQHAATATIAGSIVAALSHFFPNITHK